MVSLKIRRIRPVVCALSAFTVVALLFTTTPVSAQLLAGSADLDQTRNGGPGSPTSPAQWVNGSLNATQAHFLEGYSVPYRVKMGSLATGPGNPHSLIIEWDITKNGKHALDFITHYNRLEPHFLAFGHNAETIDPLQGLAGTYTLTPPDPGMADVIPPPSSAGSPVAGQPTAAFNALPLAERRITIYNGTITGLSYVSEASPGAGDGSSSLKIDFIANDANVVVLWGGHIATSLVWGMGNSAAQINGSSYHTRLISLDGASTGNQDRSLSAQAVIIPPPPTCSIEGPNPVCPSSVNAYTAPLIAGATYAWTITSACGATFVGGGTTASTQNVSVVACATCGSYTLNLQITQGNQNSECSQLIMVEDNEAPMINGSIANTPLACSATLPAAATTVAQLLALMGPGATITDNCTAPENLVVTSSDGGLTGTTCNGSRVRTYTVRDVCNNASMITHTFIIQDTTGPTVTGTIATSTRECSAGLPSAATTVAQLLAIMSGGAVISDNCTAQGSLVVSHIDSPLSGTTCSGTRIRTYFVTDLCGNMSAPITQTFLITDTMPPVIMGVIPSVSLECNNNLPAAATTLAQLLAIMSQGSSIVDNCTPGSGLSVSHVDGELEGNNCEGTRTRTYTVTDNCSNSAMVTQTFSFGDDSPPQITCPPTAHVECGSEFPPKANSLQSLQAQGGNATDNCGLDSIEWVSDVQVSEGVECPIVYERTYRATDTCGNTAECTQTIILEDHTPPVMCCCVTEVVGCVGFPVTLKPPVVTDECGMTITPVCSRSDGLSCSDPFPAGVTIVTWSAHDGCGNEAEPIIVTVTMNECQLFSTKMQSDWASEAATDGTLLSALLTPANGGQLFVGRMNAPSARSVILKSASAHCLADRLPASGSVGALPNGFGNRDISTASCNTSLPLGLNPSGKFKNSLIGQAMTLVLNIRYDRFSNSGNLANLQLCAVMTTINGDGVVKNYVMPAAVLSALGNNRTVGGLRELANDAIAGRAIAPATLNTINTALTRVNAMFNGNGPVALLSTSCPTLLRATAYVPQTAPPAGNATVDSTGATASPDASIGGTPGDRRPDGRNGVHVNSGLITPAMLNGLAQFDGDFVQTPQGAILIQLRGNEPVSGYDVVRIHGQADLHGALMVDLADGFMPQVGDQFEILTADSVTGSFDMLNLAALDGHSYLDVVYGPQHVTVDVKLPPAIKGDLDGNGRVDVNDLQVMLRSWGQSGIPADLNGDGRVDATDLTQLLSNWGMHN